jgi:dihydroflavonol-4-reductase
MKRQDRLQPFPENIMSERRCLVTGANGFLGLNLVKQLTKQNWRVTALCKPRTDVQYLRQFPVDLIEGDICDAAVLVRDPTEH